MKQSRRFQWTFLVLAVVQAVHSTEEVLMHLNAYAPRVSNSIHEMMAWFPVIHVDNRLFMVMNIAVVVLFLAVSLFAFLELRYAYTFALVLAYLELLNGAAHILAAIVLWKYFPGCISAAGLILAGILVIRSEFPSFQKAGYHE
jgi:hypothetical protein